MKSRVILALLIGAMFFVPVTAEFGSYAAVSQTTQLGDYTFTYDSAANTIYNLTYVGLGNSIEIASSVNATGQIPISPALPIKDTSRYLSLDGVVLYASGDSDMLLMATKGPSASITYNLVNPAVNVSLSFNFQGHKGQPGYAFAAEYGSHYIYRVTDSGYVGYIFANVNSSVTNGGKTLSFAQQGNNVLIVGLASHAGLEFMLERYSYQYKIPAFSYDASTGLVTGSFTTFTFNTSTGYISDFKRTGSDYSIFDSIQAYGNGSFGSGDLSPIFPLIQPILSGSVFYYATNTVIYSIHNNFAMQSSFFLSNGTLDIGVNSSLNMTKYNTSSYPAFYNYNYSYNYDYLHNYSTGDNTLNYFYQNYSYYNNDSLELDGIVHSGYTAIMLNRDGFVGMLLVYGGNVTISGNSLSIGTTGTAKVTFISPPGTLNLSSQVSNSFSYALRNGKIAAQFSLGPNDGTGTNMSFNYNNSVQIRLVSMGQGNASLQVTSLFHEGANFAIFIPSTFISNDTAEVNVVVKLDGNSVQSASMDNVLNSTSTTTAYYHTYKVEGGTMLLIHVPEFSTHTIDISYAPVTSPPGSTVFILAIGLATAVALAIIGFYAFRRRGKE